MKTMAFAMLLVMIMSFSPGYPSAVMEDAFVFVCMDIGNVNSIRSDVYIITDSGVNVLMDMTSAEKTTDHNNVSMTSFQFGGDWTYHEQCVNGTKKASHGIHIIQKVSQNRMGDVKFGTAVFSSSGMAEGYSLIPVNALGKEYFAVTYCEIFGTCYIVVGGIQPAEVTVTLPSLSDMFVEFEGHVFGSGDDISFKINRYESAPISCQCDLSGTYIRASADVAVFSGSRNAVVGMADRKNFLIEQLPPTINWGTTFVATCFQCSLSMSFIRILASSNTIVDMTGYGKFGISIGQHLTKRLVNTVYITSSAPILVTVFVLNRQDPAKHISLSPSMYVIAPISSFLNNIVLGNWLANYELDVIVYGTDDVDNLTTETGSISLKSRDMMFFENSDVVGFRRRFDSASEPTVHLFQGRNTKTTLGVHGFYTTADGNTISFGSINGIVTQVFSRVSYDGDAIDNDGNGLVDEENCTGYNPFDSDPTDIRDCKKFYSSDADSVGRHFLAVFPNFGDNDLVRLTIDIKGSVLNHDIGETINTMNLDQNCMSIVSETRDTASATHTINLPECNVINSTGLYDKGLQLFVNDPDQQSEVAVVVSVVGQHYMSSYTALPCDVMGTSYYALTYCKGGGPCGCTVTAVYQFTSIRIRLPDHYVNVMVDGQTYTARSMITKNLENAGKTFFFTSRQDLTGTYITATAPVAVICGGKSKRGTFMEQMLPVNSLVGKEFLIPEHISSLLIRVVVNERNTLFEYGANRTWHTLPRRGSFIDIEQSANQVHRILISKEGALVAVIQDDGITDGWMVLLASTSQKANHFYIKWPLGSTKTTLHLSTAIDSQMITYLYSGHSVNVTINETKKHEFTNSNTIGCVLHESIRNHLFTGFLTGTGGIDSNGSYAVAIHQPLHPTQICIVTKHTVNDGIDNDCDMRVDEDICVKDFYAFDTSDVMPNRYINDFDKDGMIDEDCHHVMTSSLESTTTIETTYTVESKTLFESTTTAESTSSVESTTTFESTTTAESTSSVESTTTFESTTTAESTSSVESTTIFESAATMKSIPTIYSTAMTSTTLIETLGIMSSELTAGIRGSSFTSVQESSPGITHEETILTSSSYLATSYALQQGISTDSTTELSTVPSGGTETLRKCFCSCKTVNQTSNSISANMTQNELLTLLAATKKKLSVNKTQLSSYIRKKTSASDNRTSANAIGAFGTVLLVMVPGCVMISDVISVVTYLRISSSKLTT